MTAVCLYSLYTISVPYTVSLINDLDNDVQAVELAVFASGMKWRREVGSSGPDLFGSGCMHASCLVPLCMDQCY